MKKSVYVFLVLCLSVTTFTVFSQTFTTTDYKKAEWMTARFYGAQRASLKDSIPRNWLLMNHGVGYDFTNDNDGGYDLTGGWFDCGDHPMFGQTQFYSAYVLLKGYELWPKGYGDYYSQNYAGYNKAQNFNWEGNGHDPDGIPDILNEVKYATDFFIKATRNSTTFYSQKGQGNADHKHWVTSVKMATLGTADGGQDRVMYKNVKDASMASFCGASLALMSRVYRKYDSAYADTCLAHALFAYEFAKANPGTAGSPEGSFYGANQKWQDDYASMCTELYYATNDTKYKTEALSYAGNLSNHNYCFGYNNNDDIAAYNLATLGSASAAALLSSFADQYKGSVTADGIYTGGDPKWGTLRYNANSAFVVALNSVFTKKEVVDPFIYKQLDYILGNNKAGANNSGLSFVVGFGDNYVKYPHHRNVFLNDNDVSSTNVLEIPKRNAQFGYLVGGIRSGVFTDYRDNYTNGEGGIDYSAGLVGALAFVLSKTAAIKSDTMFISNKTTSVSLTKTTKVTLSFLPANSYSDVVWTSRDTSIATVDYNGTVFGKSLGSTFIIAKTLDGHFIDSTKCTVNFVNVTGVTIDSVALMIGASKQLIANVVPLTASNISVVWSCSDSSIVQISKTGLLNAVGEGKSTVTVTTVDGLFSATGNVIVTSNPYLIKVKITQNAPIIDGFLDDADWVLNNKVSKIASGNRNNTETFGLLWDNDYLYIGVKVIDAVITTSNLNPWENDAVELYFDMNRNGGAFDSYDRHYIKVDSSSNIWQKIGTGTGSIIKSTKILSASQLTENGYSMEFAFPWSSLLVSLEKPSTSKLYGFDIGIDDCDGSISRDNQMFWAGNGNDYVDLTNVGMLKLYNDTATTPIELIKKSTIKIYPNPAKNAFTVLSETQSEVIVSLIDMYGRVVIQQVGKTEIAIDCSSVKNGFYYVKIETDNTVSTQNVIISK